MKAVATGITAIVAGCSGSEERSDPESSPDTGADNETTNPEETSDIDTVDGQSTLNRLSETLDTYIVDPVEIEGEGDSEETVTLEAGFNAIRYGFEGYELLAPLYDDTDDVVTVVNELSGAGREGFYGEPLTGGEYTIDIEAEAWEFTIGTLDPNAGEIHAPPASVTGSGNDIVGPVYIEDSATVRVADLDGASGPQIRSCLDGGDGTETSHSDAINNDPSGDDTSASGIRWFEVYNPGNEWEFTIE